MIEPGITNTNKVEGVGFMDGVKKDRGSKET